jgi:adenine-specific DNA-methyltransferase
MILGDSLQVMASLAEREGLRGKVQCIYIDPPYGIKFNSNFQWSTSSRDVKDGNAAHITREPEQVKAFRDTWRDGIHSYLTYLRDRLTVARELLAESGSIFVQIGDENVHRVRAILDEVFGAENACAIITFRKTAAVSSPAARVNVLAGVSDLLLWYAKSRESVKYRQLYLPKSVETDNAGVYTWVEQEGGRRRMTTEERSGTAPLPSSSRVYRLDNSTSTGYSDSLSAPIRAFGDTFTPGGNKHWKTTISGMERLLRAQRLVPSGKSFGYVRFIDDFAVFHG